MQIAVHPDCHSFDAQRGTNYAVHFRERQEQRILAEYLAASPGERVLDVACGNHYRYDHCTDTADLSHVLVQTEGDGEVAARSLRMPFAPKTFRAIVGLQLGEHLTATAPGHPRHHHGSCHRSRRLPGNPLAGSSRGGGRPVARRPPATLAASYRRATQRLALSYAAAEVCTVAGLCVGTLVVECLGCLPILLESIR